MSFDPIYIKSAIESLELILHLFKYLSADQKMNEFSDYLALIELKANTKISSLLGQQSGLNIPIADQEGKQTDYWEGIRDMAKLSIKQWDALQDAQQFVMFLKNTRDSLSRRITSDVKIVPGLEELFNTFLKEWNREESVSPLEDPPTPKIYYTPHPKGPPVASAEAIPKRIEAICSKCGEINEKRARGCKKCGASLIPLS